MTALYPFHLAFFVRDLDQARAFYGGVLGWTEGRSTGHWVDYDCMGHQLSLHLKPDLAPAAHQGMVDGSAVPMPHFGVVLDMPAWHALAERVRAAGTAFIVAPQVRFAGQPGEQSTMFFLDPCGNALEFKGLAALNALFAR